MGNKQINNKPKKIKMEVITKQKYNKFANET